MHCAQMTHGFIENIDDFTTHGSNLPIAYEKFYPRTAYRTSSRRRVIFYIRDPITLPVS